MVPVQFQFVLVIAKFENECNCKANFARGKANAIYSYSISFEWTKGTIQTVKGYANDAVKPPISSTRIGFSTNKVNRSRTRMQQ